MFFGIGLETCSCRCILSATLQASFVLMAVAVALQKRGTGSYPNSINHSLYKYSGAKSVSMENL